MAKGIYIGDKNDNSREIATKLLIGDKNDRARLLLKILVGDSSNRARLVYSASEVIPQEKTTIVHIYDSISGELIRTFKDNDCESIQLMAEHDYSSNVSYVFVAGRGSDDEYHDLGQIDNANIVTSGSYEYFPSYTGLSIANDDDTTDDEDILIGGNVYLESGKEYTYYLLYDGERVTIDGTKYWIPNHNITWKEAADNNLIPVFNGNSALACMYKDGIEYTLGDDDYTEGLIGLDSYKLHTVVEVDFTNEFDYWLWTMIEGTNITWKDAINKLNTGYNDIVFSIENDRVVSTYKYNQNNKYMIKSADGVPVALSDVIISCHSYIAEAFYNTELVNFYLDDKPCHAEVGMTWSEWANSELCDFENVRLDDENVIIDSGIVCYIGDDGMGYVEIAPNEVIDEIDQDLYYYGKNKILYCDNNCGKYYTINAGYSSEFCSESCHDQYYEMNDGDDEYDDPNLGYPCLKCGGDIGSTCTCGSDYESSRDKDCPVCGLPLWLGCGCDTSVLD